MIQNFLNTCLFATLLWTACAPLPEEDKSIFEGTYTATDQTIVQIRTENNLAEGVMYSKNAIVPFKGSIKKDSLEGFFYVEKQKIPFGASIEDKTLVIAAMGNQTSLKRTSYTHQLGNFDFSPYFNEDNGTSQKKNTSKKQTYSSGLQQQISGGQLVILTSSSIISDNPSSSMSYYNFCPDGSFNQSSDGSFAVRGSNGGGANGAHNKNFYGRWQVTKYNGKDVIYLNYADGDTGRIYINSQKLNNGRWRIGNTKYAFLKGKANCR